MRDVGQTHGRRAFCFDAFQPPKRALVATVRWRGVRHERIGRAAGGDVVLARSGQLGREGVAPRDNDTRSVEGERNARIRAARLRRKRLGHYPVSRGGGRGAAGRVGRRAGSRRSLLLRSPIGGGGCRGPARSSPRRNRRRRVVRDVDVSQGGSGSRARGSVANPGSALLEPPHGANGPVARRAC